MIVFTQKMIYRSDLQSNKDVIYLFGDNMMRVGMGGQAREMRGEPNAFGIATKQSPSEYFSDKDYEKVVNDFSSLQDFVNANRNKYKAICIPADGIGTGLAELEERAPEILQFIENCLANLHKM